MPSFGETSVENVGEMTKSTYDNVANQEQQKPKKELAEENISMYIIHKIQKARVVCAFLPAIPTGCPAIWDVSSILPSLPSDCVEIYPSMRTWT